MFKNGSIFKNLVSKEKTNVAMFALKKKKKHHSGNKIFPSFIVFYAACFQRTIAVIRHPGPVGGRPEMLLNTIVAVMSLSQPTPRCLPAECVHCVDEPPPMQ